MKKPLKISLWITGISAALCYAFNVVQDLLSSHMQSYYKAQLDDVTKSGEELLAKKREWAEFGEKQIIPESVFYFLFFSFFLLIFLALILKLISLKGTKNFFKKARILSGAACVLSLLILCFVNFFADSTIFFVLFLACLIAFLLVSFISCLKWLRE